MISEQHFIKMRDQVEIHSQIEEVGSPVWLIATHGVGEHLERHNYLRDLFSGHFNLFQYDLRGHGLSMGDQAYVEDFFDYMKDLKEILIYLQNRYKMKRFVLFGHSMGALITSGFLQSFAEGELYPERVYINAPPVGFPGMLGNIIDLSPRGIFSSLTQLPVSVRLGGLVDLNYLSHDTRVKENYVNDSKNSLTLHTKLLLEIVRASGEVFSRPLRPQCPSYVSVGSEDRVVGVKQLLHYFTMVEKAFTIREFDGAYHEIHNEVEKFRKPYFGYIKECLMPVLRSE